MFQQQALTTFKTVRFWKKNNSLFLVNEKGESHVVSVNLIKHVLEIPYIKKDGTRVSSEMIQSMKKRPQSRFKRKHLATNTNGY